MSEKSLKTLVGVVAVLLVLYVATAVGSGSPDVSAADDGALAAALERAGTADAGTIRILSATDTIELRRGDDGWTVNGLRADTARVAALREALREARIGHLAASNPANHARLGVTDSAARILEVDAGGDEPVRILVGNAGPSYSGVYLRLPGRDEAYLVHGGIRTHAVRAADDWRDRTIVAVDTAAVRTLDIARGDERYSVARGETGWSLEDGAAADGDAVDRLLRELARLEAAGFAPDTAPAGKAFGSLVALGADGDTLAAISLAEGAGANLRATVPGGESAFELPRWRVERLVPERAGMTAEDGEAAGA